MAEIGYQKGALVGWSSLLDETHEENPDLVWPKSIDVFDRMRREDPQVMSVLRAVMLPIMRTEWALDATGVRPEVAKHVADDFGLPIKGQPYVAPLRTKGRFSFGEYRRLALLSLVFGHSVFEQVYRVDAFGLAHLGKLAWRPPRTIAEFEVARDGGLVAVKQHALAGGADVRIPVARLVVQVNEREGANWIGQSLLRPAYKMWLLKDRVLRIQALAAERNGLGLPTYTTPPPPTDNDFTSEQYVEWMDKEIERGLDIAKNVRAGDAAGASLPHGANLSFVGVTGKVPDLDKPIRYYDEQIARAVLAHFLNLGTETGSWALGSTFANFFTDSLNAVAQQIADVTQQHVVEDLVDANWGPNEPAPRLVPATIGAEHPATAEAIKALIECGALSADPALEAHLRALYGLPVKEQAADAEPDPTAEPDATATPEDPAAQKARAIAEVVQKVYLGVGPVLTKQEARAIVRGAGADLGPDDVLDQEAEEAA
ncbi:hypothetical protein [Microbacterium sp. NPDC058389]|uniref:phage portal protein family protein n=1 Tax=Microbacterium sp. NPDC058389 TaxID=3346475 RepID=UPI00365C89AE